MKKLLAFLLMGMFLLTFASSALVNINDYKVFDGKDIRKLIIKESLLGDDKATINLVTELKENVGVGYVQIAEIEAVNVHNKDLQDFFTEINAYHFNGEELESINKTIDIKYKSYYYQDIPTYEEQCNLTENNGTVCSMVQNGTTKVIHEAWNDYDGKVLYKGQSVTIGLFTTTYEGERGEWIPTFLGKRIGEWAEWTAGLNVGLVAYYAFEEGTGTATEDPVNGHNLTSVGSPAWGVGIIGNATNLDGSEYWEENVASGDFAFNDSFTMNAWVNETAQSAFGTVMALPNDVTSGGARWMIRNPSSGNRLSGLTRRTGTDNVDTLSTQVVATWYMVTYVRNTTGGFIYMDGAIDNSLIAGGALDPISELSNISFGALLDGASPSYKQFFDGLIDETGIWDRQLTPTEITQLYNGGAGITFTDNFDDAPNVTLNAPANDTNFTTSSVNFNATVFDNINLVNVSLKIDGAIVQTNSSGINDSLYNFFEEGISNGQHNWSIIAFDNVSQSTESEVRTFNITVLAPLVTLNSPVDEFNTTTNSNTFNASIDANGQIIANVSIFFNDILNDTNSSGLAGIYLFTKTMDEGTTKWEILVCDTDNECTNSEERNINVDSVFPDINITAPPAIINYTLFNTSINLNWSINDTSLDICWYDYESVNTTVTCTANTTAITVTNATARTIIFYANDTFGNENSVSHSWDYKIFELNQTFNNASIEGSLEDFKANVVVGGGVTIVSATLNYPGNSQAGSVVADGLNTSIFIDDFVVPGVTGSTNQTFNWSLTLSDSSVILLETFNQTVSDLGVDNCSTFTNQILNFTLVDEETQLNITTSVIEIDVDILTETRSSNLINLSSSSTDINPVLICLEDAIPVGVEFSLDVVVKYSSANYSVEYYNIVDATLDSTFSQNVTLFDLLLEDNTDFLLTFKDSSFVVVEGALINVNRQYISEGTFKTVELPLTDSNGQTVVHLVESDIVYNFVVTKGGTVIGSFDNLRAFCDDATIGSCFITLNSQEGNLPLYEYNEAVGIASVFVYNDTSRILTFEFTTTDATVKTVNLRVNKSDQLGNTSICDDTVISSSGTFTCSVPAAIGNSTIFAEVDVDGSTEIMQFFEAGRDLVLGTEGLFLLFIMVITFGMMFSESKAMVIAAVILGFGVSSMLFFQEGGILSTSINGAVPAFVWLAISGVILVWKLNKEGDT